jgi:serine/threonine protein phosphatase PrpC
MELADTLPPATPTTLRPALPPRSPLAATAPALPAQAVSDAPPAPAAPAAQPATVAPPAVARELQVRSYGLTDLGRVRTSNEDQFVTGTLMRALWIQQSTLEPSEVHYGGPRGNVFIVADGMGGALGGEKASALAVGAIESFLLNAVRWLLSLDGSDEAGVLAQFKRALHEADARVWTAAAEDPGLRGMGTTLTMAYSAGTDLFLAHVGDSRGYLLRGGILSRLTRDHTLVEHMVREGVIRPEDAASHPFGHVITNVVGGDSKGVRVDVHRVVLQPGDVLLLCTDGLTGPVADAQIASTLRTATSLKGACEELVRLANEGGGKDNVTVIAASFA